MAAALLLANELLGEPLSAGRLHEIAAALGADVPFFLATGPQLGTGDGSTLEPLALPQDYTVILLFPNGATKRSTEAVYTQSGWFNTERRIAPVSRIQTVDSHIGPFERLFRLANVTVTTASAAGPLRIHGLDRTDAQALVDELVRTTQATTGDAT